MKKIVWITSDSFFDVDHPVVSSFKEESEIQIKWYIIYYENRVNNFRLNKINSQFEKSNIDVSFIQLDARMRAFSTFRILWLLLTKIKLENKKYVLYNNAGVGPYMTLLVILLFSSKRVITAVHDVITHVGTPLAIKAWHSMELYFLNNIHVYSRTQLNAYIKRYGGISKQIFMIPLYLKPFGRPALKRTSNKKIVFLFFGSIRENKGLEYLIRAAHIVAISHKGQFMVKIYGKCNDWSFYSKLIRDYSIFDLSIKPVQNSKVANLFCSSDFLVLPYKDVTQSGPLMIALNYGIPPITSDHPGFREIIEDGQNGYLFQSGNYHVLAQVMINAIDDYSSNYSLIVNNLKNYVIQNYRIEEIRNSYIEMFNKLN
jgi:glycosyltransferase involved in cell wall biosynthesis